MENNEADIGTAENNSEVQSNTPSSGLNEETLAEILRNTLFSDETEQTVNPQAENEGEAQTEVKDEAGEEDPAQDTQAEEQVPQAEDGEESEVLSQEAQDETEEGNLPKGVQKRIDKLTAKRKQAEEEIQNLRSELDALKKQVADASLSSEEANPVVTNDENPFSSLNTKEAVDKEIEQARYLRYKCMENPDGFNLGDTYYGPDDVKRMLVNATKAIEIHLPKQMNKIQAFEHIKPLAEKEYPWWSKPETKEYQLAQQVLRNFPQFRNHPDYLLFVGDYIRGFMTREAAASKAVQATPKKAPVQPIRPTAAPAKSNPNETRAKKAVQSFSKTTSAEDLAKVLLSKGLI
jgi:hypothetical protein